MSYNYKYDFISPEEIFARVKEDLQSYFDTGIIDDVLFPKHVDYCLRKIGRSGYKLQETVLHVENKECTLPEKFVAVREIHACTHVTRYYTDGTAVYSQRQVTPVLDNCEDCELPWKVVTMKTTNLNSIKFTTSHLLSPGNISTISSCSPQCLNLDSSSADSFEVDKENNKLKFNFDEGDLYMIYYSAEVDENEYQLIPDVIELIDWIEHYIKFKCFETIFNKVTDESFNQVYQKYKIYEALHKEKKVIAETQLKKRTVYDLKRSIIKSYNSFSAYEKMLMGRKRLY